ncbi:protein FAM214B [Rhinatrema bivittatum]|uniref:protein FAM214B n=1 Tax=Rhinatrema bivittatum TaxID=194408 RepID=UPI00112DBF7C|nr:protein FAM214B [Rhinatrema bivittatum]XP_029437622.1 protein FAM214B [Rhinatrema bivittatum]XP_029437630.1 protein FAM214B [Rhinatrema bivittatum]XP_029437637.1 protein FAM214B [Rhinatrema bivittatum]XP_029437642.1 protein FAM214B [Rhinatrema bivittatum]XP_029437649.1 protein FAM214B [Rhinatrema bivittatum]
MRHIHVETSSKEQGKDAGPADGGSSSPGQGNVLDPGQAKECRVLLGYDDSEIKRQKVYQVSVFSHLAASPSPSDRRTSPRQTIKRGLAEQRVAEAGRDPKRACWGSAANPRREGALGQSLRDRDQVDSSWPGCSPGSPDDPDALEDAFLAEELPLCSTAQHFSHSGLRVVEHKCESAPGQVPGLELGHSASRVFSGARDQGREGSPVSQHTSCSTLHISNQGASSGWHVCLGSRPVGEGSLDCWRKCRPAEGKEPQLFGSHLQVGENSAEGHASGKASNLKSDGVGSQNILETNLHDIAQTCTRDSCVRHDELAGASEHWGLTQSGHLALNSKKMSNGSLPGGSKEPTTPRSESSKVQISEANGLTSSEKTPLTSGKPSSSSGSGWAVKRKLLQSSETADSCSEDESQSPAKRKRVQPSHPVLASCRSTDAKAAPFWNHLLPSARDPPKSCTDCSSIRQRLKSGLQFKSRHLRSLRKGVAGRTSPEPWATSAISRSLLGNFEESILKGRFVPSGCIEGFTAEIGASGSYCPQHATLPVQVTYFDISEHSVPSPFLGVIDLEALGKKGYSVPKAGTIQVTLFNPNKTVVKMFLVTYDFKDMPTSHVTFLRHRIFLVPVEEEEEEEDGDRETHSSSDGTDGGVRERGKKILCYLMHLRFQRSKSEKIYLHKDIRLLFSRKSIEVDSGIPYELKSFTEMPRNPKYSPQV